LREACFCKASKTLKAMDVKEGIKKGK